MALDYKALRSIKGNPSAEVTPGRRLQLNPAQDYQYDMPKELITAVAEKFPMASLLNQAQAGQEFLLSQGKAFMDCLIELADAEAFRDRTAEMIELVAAQTGIRFPHCFERYVELGILALRPRDAWTVTEATTKTLTVKSYNCSLGKQLAEQGVTNCEVFCIAAGQAAASKNRVDVAGEAARDLAGSGICQLVFKVKKEG